MKRITVDDILGYGPCEPYNDRLYLKKLFGGRSYVYPPTILKAKKIPAQDRLWLILRGEILPEKFIHELACDFAERSLQRERDGGNKPDERSWNAIKVKRLWIEGRATDDELDTAWRAAGDAARAAGDAAGAAAWAAGDAARGAARAAAWAAWAAARAAAWAAGDAAWAAGDAAGDAAWAAGDAAWAAAGDAARAAAWAAAWAAWAAARAAEHEWQCEHVIRKLEEAK